MPEKETIDRAREDAREGKSPSTQAGEFVREEMHHIREGKHGATSSEQAIAIGLSKARRAGVALPPRPPSRKAPKKTRKAARAKGRAARSAAPKKAARTRARPSDGPAAPHTGRGAPPRPTGIAHRRALRDLRAPRARARAVPLLQFI